MKITSPAFQALEMIPEKYTCEGKNIHPPLHIEHIPKNAKSLAIIAEDPDAPIGVVTHWLIWNINPSTHDINERDIPKGAVQGKNINGENSFIGPCPPEGDGNHRYIFHLYALDKKLNLPVGTLKEKLLETINQHFLKRAELIGLYRRDEA
jgi:Raf kinase inhibitor-like YbhB/YbcL family protein